MVDLIYPGRLGEGRRLPGRPPGPAPHPARTPPSPGVFAWGEEEDYVFVVREFAHGSLLSELLQESGGLPPGQTLEIVRRLVEGLGALYGRGIFYTGLNPHQVWLDRKGRGLHHPPGLLLLPGMGRRAASPVKPPSIGPRRSSPAGRARAPRISFPWG